METKAPPMETKELWTDNDGVKQLQLGEKWWDWDELVKRTISFHEVTAGAVNIEFYRKTTFQKMCRFVQDLQKDPKEVARYFMQVVAGSTAPLPALAPKAKGKVAAKAKAKPKAHS